MKKLLVGLSLTATLLAANAQAGILIAGGSQLMADSYDRSFYNKVSMYTTVGTMGTLLTGMVVYGTSWAPLLPILLLDKEATAADIHSTLENNLPEMKGHSVLDEVTGIIVHNKKDVAEGEEKIIVLSDKEIDELFLRHGVDKESDNALSLRTLLASDNINELKELKE